MDLSEEKIEGVELYKIFYESDGYRVAGYIAAPADYLEKQYPVLIFNRGGNRDFGMPKPVMYANLAKHGFITLGSMYRGNDGGTGMEDFGGEDVDDVLRLIDISEELSFARKGGVYMCGRSRGGMMTYRAALLRPEKIKAIVIKAGVADCFDMYEAREQSMKDVFHELVGGTPAEYPAKFAERSAVLFAKQIKVPTLILHGTNDWRVSLSTAVKMHELLDRYGTENKMIIYQGADHSLMGYPHTEDMLQWYKEHGYDELGNW